MIVRTAELYCSRIILSDNVELMSTRKPLQSPIQTYLEELFHKFRDINDGTLADYIPELAKADPSLFGIALVTVDGHIYQIGDSQHKFTIQSISKPFTYAHTLDVHGVDYVLTKVGVEPSGEAFNEISLEQGSGRPFNPMINAGAIATSGLVRGDNIEDRFSKVLAAYNKFAAIDLTMDQDVYQSESDTGNRNRAIAYLLKNSNIIENDTEQTLDLYFRQCSILINCRDLAVMGATLANNGVNPITSVIALKSENVEKVLSIMSTCGMYNYAGGWIYDVGMPAKSGVAGGIMAVLPGQFGLAVFSPLLDRYGNSHRGIGVCRQVSIDFGLHMFDSSKASNSVIRAKYDTTTITSKRTRTQAEFDVLRKHGARIKIYELAGDLIFSATDFVTESILKVLPETDYIILDFKRVTSAKRSACYLIACLARIIKENDKFIYITNSDYQFSKLLKRYLDKNLFQEILEFLDNDTAIECCESKLIAQYINPRSISDKVLLSSQLLLNEMSSSELLYLKGLMTKQTYAKGDYIVNEGDNSQSLFFITIGEVSIILRSEKNSANKRIATLPAGMSFGEMTFHTRAERSASVRAETYVECYELTRSAYEQISAEHADMRQKLLTNISIDLSNKLRKVNQQIRTYQ